MGDVMAINCPICGFHKELKIGGSIRDIGLQAAMKAMPGVKFPNTDKIKINRYLCRCKNCGNIYSKAVVRYWVNGVEDSKSEVCPDCKSTDGEILDTSSYCPSCNRSIGIYRIGHWD